MGNNLSSSSRKTKHSRRYSSPRAVKHKKSPGRFSFGRKKAQRQQEASTSTPSAIRSIKAKVSPNSNSKKNRRSSKSSDPMAAARRSFGFKKSNKKRSSGNGLFGTNKRLQPPITNKKKGLFGKMSSHNKKRNSIF